MQSGSPRVLQAGWETVCGHSLWCNIHSWLCKWVFYCNVFCLNNWIGALNNCNHSFLLYLLAVCLFRCIMVWISLWEYRIFYNAKRSRSTRIRLQSEYELYPLRRPYHRFWQRSLKPSKWVRNRQSSVRNQLTSANGDDASHYRYRYYVVFLAVYSETHVILLIQYDVSKMAFACVGALYMLYP